MATTPSRASSKLVDEDIPCVDSGSFLKLYYNTFFREPFNGVKIVDDVPVHVVCSDVYCGKDSKQRVKESSAKLHYFSYRNRFSRLPDGTSTDTRWGCLARTGQMLLATALLRFHAQRGPTLGAEEAESLKSTFRAAFMDRADAPLGLHQIEDEAHKDGAAYATWLSPTQLAVVLTGVVERYRQQGGRIPHAVCGKDRDINAPHIRAILAGGEPVILFIPLALGLDAISEKYQRVFFELLDSPSGCGIAGGVKKASYYFFGHQGSNVAYYDPHYVQRAYRSSGSLGEARSHYKMSSVKRLSPFMLTAFYIGSNEDLEALMALVEGINKGFPFPLISLTGRTEAAVRPTADNAGQQVSRASAPASPSVELSGDQPFSNPLSPVPA